MAVFADFGVDGDKIAAELLLDQGTQFVGHRRVRCFAGNVGGPTAKTASPDGFDQGHQLEFRIVGINGPHQIACGQLQIIIRLIGGSTGLPNWPTPGSGRSR